MCFPLLSGQVTELGPESTGLTECFFMPEVDPANVRQRRGFPVRISLGWSLVLLAVVPIVIAWRVDHYRISRFSDTTPVDIRVYKLAYVDAVDLAAALAEVFPDSGFKTKPTTNCLEVEATAKTHQQIHLLLPLIDRKAFDPAIHAAF
jgi:hypothetical protein